MVLDNRSIRYPALHCGADGWLDGFLGPLCNYSRLLLERLGHPLIPGYPMTTPGAPYQAQLILGKDYKFNQTAYEEYSSLLLPAAFVLRWAGMMALLPAMPIFVYLWHRNLFAPIFKSWFKSDPLALWKSDVHCCLMSRYKEVPPVSNLHLSR